jgi:effector-binding domain-containing protein
MCARKQSRESISAVVSGGSARDRADGARNTSCDTKLQRCMNESCCHRNQSAIRLGPIGFDAEDAGPRIEQFRELLVSQHEAARYEVSKEERDERPTLTMRVGTSMDKISEDIGRIYQQVTGYLEEAGVEPVMPPFAWYHHMSEGTIDMEAGVGTTSEYPGNAHVKPSRLPGGSVAVVWYIGPYGPGMGQAYKAVEDWMAAEGYEPAAGPWENYWTDPEETAPEENRTEIVWPIRKKS